MEGPSQEFKRYKVPHKRWRQLVKDELRARLKMDEV